MPAIGRAGDGMDSDAILADLLRRVRRLEKRKVLIESAYTVATSGSATTIPDIALLYTMIRITLSANCTLTFPAAVAGCSFTLKLIQDGTGSRTVTWPSSSVRRFAGGTTPTLSTAASAIDTFAVVCDDGTKWDVYFAGPGMA